jgi:HK97 family phage portal protein
MFSWLKRKSSVSNLSSSQLIELLRFNSAGSLPDNYISYAREAYSKNIVAFNCINKIARAVADIPIYLKINGDIVDKHPLLDLLKRPNPSQSYNAFMHAVISYKLIAGNCYIRPLIVSTGTIMELQALRPDRVTIRTNGYDEPIAYEYTINNKHFIYPIDPLTLESEILHLKEFNPLCDLYGLSPIRAAALSIDQHNESSVWNRSLLKQGARPPGIITIKNDSLSGMTEQQIKDIQDKISDKYSGSNNAGKIPVVGGELDWKNMGFSPQDMEWLNGKNSTARDICLAFGFPPMLLGLPEGSTYNNVAEAKLALYEETVIPHLQNVLNELSNHFNKLTKPYKLKAIFKFVQTLIK